MDHWDRHWSAITPNLLWNLLSQTKGQQRVSVNKAAAASSDLAVLTEELAVFTELLRSLKSGVISHASLISNV